MIVTRIWTDDALSADEVQSALEAAAEKTDDRIGQIVVKSGEHDGSRPAVVHFPLPKGADPNHYEAQTGWLARMGLADAGYGLRKVRSESTDETAELLQQLQAFAERESLDPQEYNTVQQTRRIIRERSQ